MAITADQQKRLDYLKMLVSIRVEEYFQAPQEDDTSIPFGDITYELNQAARYVMRQVPRNISFFGSKAYTGGVVIEISGKNGAIVPLPDDYLRFTRFKMQGWDLPVNEYMSDISKAYQQQQFEMRRGTNEKPVAFLIPYAESQTSGTKSRQALEVYPYADGQIEHFDYVPYMKSYDLPEEFEDVLVWRATSSVLVTMRRFNDSKAALEQMAIAESAINTGLYGEERHGQAQ